MRFISQGQGGSKAWHASQLSSHPANNPYFHSTFFVYIRNLRHHHDKNALPPSLMGPTPNQPHIVTLPSNPTAHLPSLINTHSFLSHLNPDPSKILNPTHYPFLFFFNKLGVQKSLFPWGYALLVSHALDYYNKKFYNSLSFIFLTS